MSGDSNYPASPSPVNLAAQPIRITGLHHLTLICSDLEQTTAFYRDVLGLALVDESVNADDPATRHFWFSTDPASADGTALRLSFIEYPKLAPAVQGVGGIHHLALSVGSVDEVTAWRDYLQSRSVPTTESFNRDQLCSIYLRDPDGQIIEIAAAAG